MNSASIYYTKMYKLANGMSPEIMNEIFQPRGESHYSITSVIHINSLFHQYKVLLQKTLIFRLRISSVNMAKKFLPAPHPGAPPKKPILNRVKIIIYTFIFCLWWKFVFWKFAIVWPVFDIVAMFLETHWKFFSCISNIQDFVLGTLCSVQFCCIYSWTKFAFSTRRYIEMRL